MSLKLCSIKHASRMAPVDREDLSTAANDYVERGMERQAAEEQAILDKLDELKEVKAGIEAQVLAEFERKMPARFNKIKAGIQDNKEPIKSESPVIARGSVGSVEKVQEPIKESEPINTIEIKSDDVEAPDEAALPVKDRIGADDAPAPKAEPSPKKADLQDVGDALTWNKKGKFKAGGLKWNDIKDENETLKVKLASKAKVWAKPNWEQIVDGVPEAEQDGFKLAAYLIKKVYDSIPNQSPKSDDESLQAYISAVDETRKAAESLLGDMDAMRGIVAAIGSQASRRSLSTIDIATLGDTRGLKVMLDAVFPVNPETKSRWQRGTPDHKRAMMLGNKAIDAMSFDIGSAVKAVKAIADGWPASQEAWQRQGYTVVVQGEPKGYAETVNDTVYGYVDIVGPRGKTYERLGKFDTVEAAEKAANARAEQLAGKHALFNKTRSLLSAHDTEAEAIEAARAQTSRKSATSKSDTSAADESWWERAGTERRENNRDVTPEDLKSVFNFRGVNFGKWVNQKERQQHINAAFDALHDLAAVMNIPPSAIGLGGEVGIAFGAQGGGGNFAAHFVPGVNEINITKTMGAGSVAHEWAHALDHYFGVMAGRGRSSNPFASHLADYEAQQMTGADGQLRPEVATAITGIYQAMSKKQESMLEAIAANRRGLEQAKKNLEFSIKQRGVREKIAGNQAAVDALIEIEKGNVGDYVALPVPKGKRKSPGAIPANIKTVFDAMGMTPTEMHRDYIHLQGVSFYVNKKESDINLRKVHTDFYKRSSKREKGAKPYWTTPHEMFARAFESWVLDRLANDGNKNNYLVRADKGEKFAEGDDTFAYPAGEERQIIGEAFDKLIAEINVKENERGDSVLYSLAKESPSSDQTDTAAFKNWFGDSKVVDENGKPLVVYHGTGSDFTVFDSEKVGKNFDQSTLGFYFTNAAEFDLNKGFGFGSTASEYAKNAAGNPNIIPAYLKLNNPLILDDAGEWGGAAAALDVRHSDIARWMAAGNHDGVIAYDATGDDPERIYVVRRSEQIKSATGNNGEFDPSNPDIRYKAKPAGSPSITRDAAQAVVDRISSSWAVDVKVKLVEALSDLPADVRQRLSEDGKSLDDVQAMFHPKTGNIYLNASKLEDATHVEQLIFHEVYTHMGLQALFGDALSGTLSRLYLAMGGQGGIDRLSKSHGIDLSSYNELYKDQRADYRNAVIAEELLAHLAEDTKPSVAKYAKELIGAIRAWLRKNGFAELAAISESDLVYLLKQARETVTKGKQGDTAGLIYALAGLSKQDRKMLNAQRDPLKYSLDGLPEKARKMIEGKGLLELWGLMAQSDEAFSYPTSDSTDIKEVFELVGKQQGITLQRQDFADKLGRKQWAIIRNGEDTGMFVIEKGDEVYLNVALGGPSEGGSALYAAAGNYAYNAGKVFIGDPNGLSDEAVSRRLENMISLALKFGTTKHIRPHARQVKGAAGVDAVSWIEGADSFNLRSMIMASYKNVLKQMPELESLRYDINKDTFVDEDGNEIAPKDFDKINNRIRGEAVARGSVEGVARRKGIPYTTGRRSNQRALLTHTFLRGTSSEKSELLEAVRRGQPESSSLRGILYSLDSNASEKTRFGGFSFGGSKTPRGATLPHQLKEAYNQLGGGHKTLYEKVKTEVKRQLAPRGLLPREIFDLKIARDGVMSADDSQQRYILTDFYEQIVAIYHKPYHELTLATRKEINDYLKGDRTAVKLTDSMIEVLARMRTQIQSLSKSYMNELLLDAANLEADGKLEAAAAKRALIETITENFDSYLHRSYRAFDDPEWPNKVPEDVYQNAINFLAKQYAGDEKPTADHIDEATKKVDLMLHEGTAYDSIGRFISESKLGSKDLSMIKKRKQIAPEIRALLGEYEDPAINYAKSVTKMSRLVHNTAFLRQMTDISLQLGYIFEEENRPLGANKKIAADASEVYAPLNGMYTYPEFEQALRDAVGANTEPDWYKVMVAANGAVKYGKTVLAPTTAVRNFLSASMFSLTSGHWNAVHLEKSVKVVNTYFTGKDVRGSREYIKKLLTLGVLYDAPNYRELQDLIKSVNESEHWLARATRKSKLGKALNFAQEFYALGDDFWKILGFENEKAMLMKHYKMSEADAEKEAAERIRNTYPTYSLTGKGIQWLRRFPVIGSFPSFPAEIIRTTYHKFRYYHKDAKALGHANPAVLAKGVGLALGAGMMAGLSALSASMFDVGDEEEEAIRQMLPEWSKSSSLFFLGRDEKGQVQYMDLGWLDPYGYWKKPIAALARDGDMSARMGDAAWEALSPFLGLDIAAGTVGEYVYNAFFNDSITSEKANEKLFKGLAPGFVNNGLGFLEAANGTVTNSGKKYTLEDEALALIGFRKGTLNAKVGLTYQAYGYADKKRQAAVVLREKATDMGKVDEGDLRAAYEKSMGMHRDAWNDMRRTVKMAMKTGMTQSEAVGALRLSGMSLQDARAIAADREFVYRPSKTMMKTAIMRTGILFDQETQKELIERQKRLQELQREYMEKPAR